MALNREMTMEEKKIREYTESQISRAGQLEHIVFTDEQRDILLDYASTIGDQDSIRQMVWKLSEAIHSEDEQQIEDTLWDCRKEMESYPDPTVGLAELRGYGYHAGDMFPIRKEKALDLHRVGEKIYCLQSNGSHGEYASREMIQAHGGLFGIEKEAWKRMNEQEEDYEMGELYPPMDVLNKEDALKMFDAGERIYLITTYPMPIVVQERMEIERGADYFQMDKAELEIVRDLEDQMKKYPQIQSLREAKLLLGKENRFGIYQISDDSPGREYKFMNRSFMEKHGYQALREDYQLVYTDWLSAEETLESIYERFNTNHPVDFTGHSLSVSDVVVFNENGTVKAYFVDSISFQELPGFLRLEAPLEREELAYQIGEQYFAIQLGTEGYDYSIYNHQYQLVDGGIFDDLDLSIEEVAQQIISDEGLAEVERIPMDYELLQEKVAIADEILLENVREGKTGEAYKTLAKVEELEEANYNMIDNVLNNMPPKREPYLEYYAAECDEYHDLAKMYRGDNLEEILARYRAIVEDPTLDYYGNGMGFIYRDLDNSLYDETEITIISGKSIHGDNLDHVAYMAAMPVVQDALEKIRAAFPEYRYYPPKEVQEAFYPEHMTAEELAAALDLLAQEFDYYNYQDYSDPTEDPIETVALELRCGNAHKYIPFLKDVVEEECVQSAQAEALLERIKSYEPELPKEVVPVVRVNFCDAKEFQISGYQKLSELDQKIATMDEELSGRLDENSEIPDKTVQMYLTIYYPDQDRMKELKGKITLGEGLGGIVQQLKDQNEMKLHDESWLNYQKGKGEEAFQAYMMNLTDIQEHVLPYLQTFCSLEERTPERVLTPVQESITGENRSHHSEKEKLKSPQPEKKSIHERIRINKEIISKQRGKDEKGKGVELIKA